MTAKAGHQAVVGLSGCISTIFAKIAANSRIELTDLEVEVEHPWRQSAVRPCCRYAEARRGDERQQAEQTAAQLTAATTFAINRCGPSAQCGPGNWSEMAYMRPIGVVRSPYTETAAIPKGLGAVRDAEGTLELEPEYEVGLTDIDGFSHLFVLWMFHRATGFDLVVSPPFDTAPHGVFATRAPRRPNPIGLTVVRLLGRDGPRLRVHGVDMLDGTPLLDIKPYLSGVPEAALRRGWIADAEARRRGDA